MKNLKSIRDAAVLATQGEWELGQSKDKRRGSIFIEGKILICSYSPEDMYSKKVKKDFEYIALANPSTMIKLLDYIQDLERCVEVQKIALQEIGKPVSLDDHILTRPLDNMSDANESLTTVEGILKKYE